MELRITDLSDRIRIQINYSLNGQVWKIFSQKVDYDYFIYSEM